MRRTLSLLIEFLIYSSFALLALSYVLYYVYFVSEREKTKLDIENIINILNEFHATLSIYKGCGICSFTFKKSLPEKAELLLVNNSNYINVTYFSRFLHMLNRSEVEILIHKEKEMVYYNIAKPTYLYFIENSPTLNLSKEVCLKVTVFFEKISLKNC